MQKIDACRKDLESYTAGEKPVDYEQLRTRNLMRVGLVAAAQAVHYKAKFLLSAKSEAESAIDKAEAAQLEEIDRVEQVLKSLRNQTSEEFQKCRQEEARA